MATSEDMQPRLAEAGGNGAESRAGTGASDTAANGGAAVTHHEVLHADDEAAVSEKLSEEKLIFKAFRRARKWRRRLALHQAVLRVLPKLPTVNRDKLVDFTTSSGRRVRFRFASFENITSVVNPLIAAQGLVILFTLKGRKLYGHLLHEGGGSLKSWLKLPKNIEAAEVQSEISKRRRYIEIALLNIAAEETEDSLPEDANRTQAPRGTRTRSGQRQPARRPAGNRGNQAEGTRKAAAATRPAAPKGTGGSTAPAGGRPAGGRPRPAPAPAPAATPKPAPTAAAEPAPKRTPAQTQGGRRQAPPPAGASRPAGTAAKPATPPPSTDANTAEWLYKDTPVANRLRDVLPQLSPTQAAKLRTEHAGDPDAMLREALKLHEHIYGSPPAEGGAEDATPPAGSGDPPAQERGSREAGPGSHEGESLATRIDNAFNKLEMPEEDRRALRTEYAGREQELFDRLYRTYKRRRDEH